MAEPKARVPQPTTPPRDRGSTFGWAIAGIVAVVAIVAVAFIATAGSPQPDQNQITAAMEQGRVEGAEGGMADATEAATDATTAKAEAAAREAQATALSAEDAVSDASSTTMEPIGPPQRR